MSVKGESGIGIGRMWKSVRVRMQNDGGHYYRTQAFFFGGFAGGLIYLPVGWTACVLYVCSYYDLIPGMTMQHIGAWDRATTTMYDLVIGNGANKLQPDKPYELPAEVFTAGPVQFECQDGSGALVDQGAALDIWFGLKG